MKGRWVWLAASIAVLCIFAGSGLRAQDRDHDQDRDRMGHFTDRDRDVLRHWYNDHAAWIEQNRGEGVRDDDLDRRLQPGAVVDRGMRHWSHPLPDDAMSQMDPIPLYWRIVVIGDHAVLVDDEWSVQDVVHLERFGDRGGDRGADRPDDHDQEVVREWNRDHPNFVRDLMANFGIRVDDGDLDRRLQVGMIVDRDLRQMARNAPPELVQRLTPGPRDSHYLVFGDRLCLIDHDWRVRASFRFQH